MNLIVQAILKIFQAIFEEDANRRQTARPAGQGQPAPQSRDQRNPAPRQGRHGEQDPQSVLADFFRELQGVNAPPPPPTARQQRPPARPTSGIGEESLKDHLRRQEAHIKDLDARSGQMSARLKQHLGVAESDFEVNEDHRVRTLLPGKTPLQQMIYAGVILGPCKAKQPRGRLL